MRASIADIAPRLGIKENKQQGIQNYDIDNCYPQRIRNAVKSSGRTMQCTNILERFIRGNGFAIPFYKTVVNNAGLTVDKFLRKVVRDYVLYKGFAVHVNYNMLGEIVSMTPMPFEESRLGIENEKGSIELIKHHPDWARESSKQFKKELIIEFNVYNPDKEIVLQEADLAGGFSNYKGQVFWYSPYGMKYPEAFCDPVLEDVVSDDEAVQALQFILERLKF